jgi:hypothetical protein
MNSLDLFSVRALMRATEQIHSHSSRASRARLKTCCPMRHLKTILLLLCIATVTGRSRTDNGVPAEQALLGTWQFTAYEKGSFGSGSVTFIETANGSLQADGTFSAGGITPLGKRYLYSGTVTGILRGEDANQHLLPESGGMVARNHSFSEWFLLDVKMARGVLRGRFTLRGGEAASSDLAWLYLSAFNGEQHLRIDSGSSSGGSVDFQKTAGGSGTQAETARMQQYRENANVKFRAGDYRGALSVLEDARRAGNLTSDEAGKLDRMISSLHKFLDKHH